MPNKQIDDNDYVWRTLKPDFKGKFEGQDITASTSRIVRVHKDSLAFYKGWFIEDEVKEKKQEKENK